MKPYIASDLRDMNRRTIFQLLCENDEISKAELARRSGISTPTVIKIADFFREKDLILEVGERSASLGRKPMLLSLNRDAIYAVGVILEGEYIRAGVVNLLRESYPVCVRHVGSDLEDSLRTILPEMIDSLIAEGGINPARIRGIGIGIPGGYNPATHEINFAPLIHINEPFSLRECEQALGARFSAPVFVDNDANMAVLGEYQARRTSLKDLVYISLGTGIGAGIILEGRLRQGGTRQCGEIGYMTFSDDYRAGRANPGWLESRINLKALHDRFGFEAFGSKKDVEMERVEDYVASLVAVCISNIVSVLDCQTVVLGGMLVQALGDSFLQNVQRRVAGLSVLEVSIESPLCSDPGVVGAASVALDAAIQTLLTMDD